MQKVLDEDGIPLERVPLDENGDIAATEADINVDTYLPGRPVDYSVFAY